MDLVKELRKAFEPLRDPKRAESQSAYMKGNFPFLGVTKPEQAKVSKEMFKSLDGKNWETAIRQLWECKEREFHWTAIDLALFHQKKWNPDHLPLFEWMVRTNSWWDSVDDIAEHLLGQLLLRHPDLIQHADRWIDDDFMWIRRTALIFQMFWREKTDEVRLFRYCLKRAEEKEFFIRKAIGWALRQYGKTRPKAVFQFTQENKKILSPLSFREATRLLQNFL